MNTVCHAAIINCQLFATNGVLGGHLAVVLVVAVAAGDWNFIRKGKEEVGVISEY